MSEIETLNSMIHPDAKVPIVNCYDKASVILKEDKAPESTVEIKGVPQNAVVIKIDDAFKNDQFFSGSKGECKRADYAIIADTGKKKRIIYIELKKTSDQLNKVIKQLQGAECVMNYCCIIASVFYERTNFLADYEPRFISFAHTGMGNKRRTRINRSNSVHDTPGNVMKIDWPANIQFNRLVG